MSKMVGVAAGLAVVVAVVFGGIYLLPDETTTPTGEGAAKAVAYDKALAEDGKQVVDANGCSGCHSIDGSKGAGPSFKAIYGTEADIGGEKVPVDDAFLKAAIVDPNSQVLSGYGPSMPSYEGKLSDEEIKAVVEYIKSLNG